MTPQLQQNDRGEWHRMTKMKHLNYISSIFEIIASYHKKPSTCIYKLWEKYCLSSCLGPFSSNNCFKYCFIHIISSSCHVCISPVYNLWIDTLKKYVHTHMLVHIHTKWSFQTKQLQKWFWHTIITWNQSIFSQRPLLESEKYTHLMVISIQLGL